MREILPELSFLTAGDGRALVLGGAVEELTERGEPERMARVCLTGDEENILSDTLGLNPLLPSTRTGHN